MALYQNPLEICVYEGGLLEQLVSSVKVPRGRWERKGKEWKTEMRRHQRARHGYHHGYRQLRLQKQRLCHVVGMCMWENRGDRTRWKKKKKKGIRKSCSAVAVGLVSEWCPRDARDKIPQLSPNHYHPCESSTTLLLTGMFLFIDTDTLRAAWKSLFKHFQSFGLCFCSSLRPLLGLYFLLNKQHNVSLQCNS